MKTLGLRGVNPFLALLSLFGGVGSADLAQAQQTTWQSQATQHRGKNGQRFTYECPAGDRPIYTVYGTDIYTDDSSVCTAAVHAGLISVAGGTVTIEIRPGASSYTGSTRNGVTTNGYSWWHGSFVFPGTAPPPPTNRPPNPPTLIGPRNGYAPAISARSITLQWQGNGDPDGDPVSFELQIYIWNAATGQWQMAFQKPLYGTSLSLPPWTPNAYHAWRVFAIDGNRRSNPWYAASGWSVFYTSP